MFSLTLSWKSLDSWETKITTPLGPVFKCIIIVIDSKKFYSGLNQDNWVLAPSCLWMVETTAREKDSHAEKPTFAELAEQFL